MSDRSIEEREGALTSSVEKLKAALRDEAAKPDFSQPTPAEAAQALAERMERDARRAISATRFVHFTG